MQATVDMQEYTIIQNARNGDNRAFQEIVERYGGFVYSVSFRMYGNHRDAEEITQDVFITVFQKLADFEFRSSFKTWLYRITVNHTINFCKKKRRKEKRHVSLDTYSHMLYAQDALRVRADEEHAEHVVLRLCACLNQDEHMCIILRSLEGLAYEEIAEVLGVNINTVRSRLKRAREKMIVYSKKVADEL